MNTEEILEKLKYNTGVFPRQALQEAVAIKEQITPALLRILEEAKQLPEVLYEYSYIAHIYAMYLLAQFREKRAYPLIVEFFSIPDKITLDCTGDVVTEDLHRILVSVSHGDASLIKSLAGNEDVDKYVRSAALDALLTQVACGEGNREEVMAYYQSLFRGGLAREPSYVWDSLVSCSTDLYPEEVVEDIRQAFDEGLVDGFFTNFRHVGEKLARGKERVLEDLTGDSKRRLIEDVIEDMEWWACFHRSESQTAIKTQSESLVVTRKQKVGRNQPCPCGSGRKYKKCCGR